MHFAKEMWAILKWCSILGVLPWYNWKMRCFVLKRMYTILETSILLLMFVVWFWGLYKLNYHLPMKASYVLLIAFTTLVQNVKLSLWNVEDLSRLFKEMEQLDLKLVQRLDFSAQKHTTAMYVVVNILSVPLYSCSIFLWKQSDVLKLIFSIALFYNYLYSVQSTLQLFILRGICKRSKCVSQVVQGYSQQKYFESDLVANVGLLQGSISRIVDTYNKLFGWNIFLHILVMFVGLLYLIYTYLERQGTGVSFLTQLPHFITLCLQLLHILILSMQGQAVCNDSDKIVSSCCELLVNSGKGHNHNRAMGLLQQVSVRQTRISAAGFFDINFPMVFMLINLLVTYIIAVVQLMPK